MPLFSTEQPTGSCRSSAAEKAPSLSFQCTSWFLLRCQYVGFLAEVSSLIVKESFVCWITGWTWKTLIRKLLLTKYPVWSWVQGSGPMAQLCLSARLQPCRKIYFSHCVSVSGIPYLANVVSGVDQDFWSLHSTIHHLDLISIEAFHKEKCH